MKVVWLLACTNFICLIGTINGSAIQAPLEVISYDDISPEERKELDYLQHKLGRPKRSGSGSGDILESLKVAIGQGIKNKIGELAKGSAAATARLSSSSSDHSYSYHHSPHPPESYDHKSVDFWSLKKSILNTLLQAVKAIKGGVIAVKGQLIKGGGYLTSAAGKLIVAKGDAVTNLGKKLAASAVLVPYHGSSSGHAEYGPPHDSHYSAPSAPEPEFYHGAPSAPGPEFHQPDHHYPYHGDRGHDKEPSGLLILKKIHGDHHYHHHNAEESKIPTFKPTAPSGPSFGTIVGKFLSASSSLDPHKPEPFGHTASGDTHPYHSHSDQNYEVSESQDHHEVAPSASGYVVNDEPVPKKVKVESKPSYNSPFETEPSYLNQNFDDYVGTSFKDTSQNTKINSITLDTDRPDKDTTKDQSELSKPYNFVKEYDYPSLNVPSLGTAPSSSALGAYNIYNLPNIGDYPNGFPSSSGEILMSQVPKNELPSSPLNVQNLYYPSQSQNVIDLTNTYVQPEFDESADNFISPNELLNYYKHSPHLPSSSVQSSKPSKTHSHPPSSHSVRRPTRLTQYDSASSSSKYRSKSTRPKHSSTTYHKRPSSSSTRTSTKHKPKQTYDVVKSIAYELGPNGPKKLT